MNSQSKETEPAKSSITPNTPLRQGWFDGYQAEGDVDAWAEFKETPEDWDEE